MALFLFFLSFIFTWTEVVSLINVKYRLPLAVETNLKEGSPVVLSEDPSFLTKFAIKEVKKNPNFKMVISPAGTSPSKFVFDHHTSLNKIQLYGEHDQANQLFALVKGPENNFKIELNTGCLTPEDDGKVLKVTECGTYTDNPEQYFELIADTAAEGLNANVYESQLQHKKINPLTSGPIPEINTQTTAYEPNLGAPLTLLDVPTRVNSRNSLISNGFEIRGSHKFGGSHEFGSSHTFNEPISVGSHTFREPITVGSHAFRESSSHVVPMGHGF